MLLSILRKDLQLPHILSTVQRYHSQALYREVPLPRGSIKTPKDFLAAIGRSCETKLQISSWNQLWTMGGMGMRKAGLAVKDRRYILWALSKFRLGEDPAKFSHEERPKKTIRGWGPSVQFGKRIRSRRRQ